MTHTVVHFVDGMLWGGCEEVVLTLLSGLDRNRWRPVLFHRDAPGIARLLREAGELGITCRAVPQMTTWNLPTTLPRFLRELRQVGTVIFHAHLNWPLACRFEIMAAGLGRIPGIIATSHLYTPILDVRFGWLKQRLQSGLIHRYIAVSHGIKNCLCQELQVPEAKVRVVHNSVRTARFNQPSDPVLRAKLVDDPRRPLVLTSARMHTQKGHRYLLEAAALLPEAVFVLAGDGPERAALEERVRKLGIEDRVRFLGQRDDIHQLLACCDLFVLPSLFEGLPLSVLEAMAAGKPVIATAIPGTEEAVVHGKTGLLVQPANAVQLASAIRTLLADRELSARMAEAGKARVMEGFSAKRMVRDVESVYRELLPEQL